MKKKISVYTLGCRVNQYETEAFQTLLENEGFEIIPFGDTADLTIINTCTVTSESDRKSKQMIRRAARINGKAPVIVTGCMAQTSPEAAKQIPGVVKVIGNSNKSAVISAVKELLKDETSTCSPASEKNIFESCESLIPAHPVRTRQYIKIQDGCESKCAYCIIPKARGPVRSKPIKVITDEILQCVSHSCCEFILTGIETASYGADLSENISLINVLEEVSKIDGVKRLTLGSLDPSSVNRSFLNGIQNIPVILPHFHLSLQSGSSRTLKRMRRKYNADQAMYNIINLKSSLPDVTLSADIIVGFPGETEKDFLETAEFIKSAEFLHLHIFPYSKRNGTEAAGMPDQIPECEKKQRASYLESIQKEIKYSLLEKYKNAHRTVPASVLIEEEKNGTLYGHTEHYVEVSLPGNISNIGCIVPALISAHDGKICSGNIENS